MKRKELIKKYLEFFKLKNHKEIPNAPLIPENDPTVLFTTAGMHPLTPYLLGHKHPLGKRLVGVQKCIRTSDIEMVGDETHHTFFEMLGNWSLGDYWKKEAIEMSFEFLTKVLKIPKEKLAVTCFEGDKDAKKDEESARIWKSLGIKKIKFLGKKDNWWGPAGNTGPCGPDTEMFVNRVEIWNDVFMQYVKDKRLILADGMHCLYDKNFKINKELLDKINSLNTHCVLVVNNHREKGLKLIKENSPGYGSNWMAFSLEETGIKKDNPKYFKRLIGSGKSGMTQKKIIPEEVLYFDHKKENIETAKKLGILSNHHKSNRKTEKFVQKNLYTHLPAKQKNIDTGMGVERTLAVLNGLNDNYQTELWKPIIKKIEKLSGKKYKDHKKEMRIIADHIKAAIFLFNDGVNPGHKERGYVLKRLIRRATLYGKKLGLRDFTYKVGESVFDIYLDYFPRNDKRVWFIGRDTKTYILQEMSREEATFNCRIEEGLKILRNIIVHKNTISPQDAFLLYQSYGFPIELTEEIAKEKGYSVDRRGFEYELKKHQQLSRTASAGRFKSGLADSSEKTTKLHTANHLLLSALRKVLKDKNIIQKGSNITPERLRFDFSFPRKLTDEEIKKVEGLVNEQIKKELPVIRKEMSPTEAKKKGAMGIFDKKYGEKVSVYAIGRFSKEICAGPHVKNTKELGKFKIVKEEGSSAGVRRIKAIIK